MEQVIYRAGIEQAASLRHLADEVMSQLEEVLGASAKGVSAEWDCAEDASGRSLIILRLSDSTGSATAVIDPKELEQPRNLESRFRRLWGDLLRIRSHKLLKNILEADGGQGGN